MTHYTGMIADAMFGDPSSRRNGFSDLDDRALSDEIESIHTMFAYVTEDWLTTIYAKRHRIIAEGRGSTPSASLAAAQRALPPRKVTPAPSAAPFGFDMLPILPGKDMVR